MLVNIPGAKRLTIQVSPDVGPADYDLDTTVAAMSAALGSEMISQLVQCISQLGIKSQLYNLHQVAINSHKNIAVTFLEDGNILAHSEEANSALEELSFDEILAQEGLEDEDDD